MRITNILLDNQWQLAQDILNAAKDLEEAKLLVLEACGWELDEVEQQWVHVVEYRITSGKAPSRMHKFVTHVPAALINQTKGSLPHTKALEDEFGLFMLVKHEAKKSGRTAFYCDDAGHSEPEPESESEPEPE